jgi:hypothetical protein
MNYTKRMNVGKPAALLLLAAIALVSAAAGEPSSSDREIEKFLTTAKVTEDKPLGSGVTKSRKWRLELDGERRKAVFKTVDMYQSGVRRDAKMGFQSNFDDSYRYDRAAYLLDRRLGLGRVPVVVLRTVDKKEGAVIDWINDAVSEKDRQDTGEPQVSGRMLDLQKSMMAMFDSLILNDDRNLGNLLWTEDGRMHWIDHSRAFRMAKNLQPIYTDGVSRLTRQFYGELKSLELGEMSELLDGLLSKKRIKAIVARLDLILKKIDADLEQYGETVVFPVERLD